MTRLWCERALLPSGLAERVTLDVADGRIASVAVGTAPPPGIAPRRGLTMPGAADAHSHAFHRALRHRSQRDRGTFWTWREQMYAFAAALDPERYHRLARAVFGELVLAGYTSVGEFHYLHHAPGGRPYADPNAMGEALAAAAADAGVRITLLDTLYLHGGLDAGGHAAIGRQQERFSDRSVEAWAARAGDRRAARHVRLGAAVHSVRAVDRDAIRTAAEWAAGANVPLHAHVSEQPAEAAACADAYGCSPTELLADAGALSPSFTAVHATHVTDHDVALLARAGATVCVCPTTELDLGDGIAPARRLLDAGVPLAVGSDSHAVVDPFAEVRTIELGERATRGARGVLTTRELVDALTAGHRAIGWDDAGAIEPGRRADLVTVSLTGVRTAGGEPDAVVEAALFGATVADVTHVTVDGIDVVVDGRHRAIDVAGELAAAIRELVETAGRDVEVAP